MAGGAGADFRFQARAERRCTGTARPRAARYEIHADRSRDAIKIDPAEAGWKNTIRVDPAKMAIVAVPFRAYAPADVAPEQGTRLYITGRYMYHCHILEHEDHEMMRPYIVMPAEVIDHMGA